MLVLFLNYLYNFETIFVSLHFECNRSEVVNEVSAQRLLENAASFPKFPDIPSGTLGKAKLG